MSGGIEHSERSAHAWMVDNLTTAQLMKPAGTTTAPRQAGRVPAKIQLMPEPPALMIDKVILIFALGVYLGMLIK